MSPTVSRELALERAAYVAEIDYEKILKLAKPFRYVPLPKFAEITRDLALTCDRNITCAQLEKEIYASCKYVSDVKLFDVYIGEQVGSGKKSMAFTITFTPKDEPIEERIDGFVNKILKNLEARLDVFRR